MEARIGRIKHFLQEPSSEFPLDALASPCSMWSTVQAIRRRRGIVDPHHVECPSIITGKFAKLYLPQQQSIAIAILYWLENGTFSFHTRNPDGPPLGRRCSNHASQRCHQLQSLACGAGKTAILLWLAVLSGMNALIATEKNDQICQLIITIHKETNIAKYFPVRFVRAADDDGKTDDTKDKEILDRAKLSDLSTRRDKTHILERGEGICVIERYTFLHDPKAKDERREMQLFIFGMCRWDTFLADEFDSLMGLETRRSFLNGLTAHMSET